MAIRHRARVSLATAVALLLASCAGGDARPPSAASGSAAPAAPAPAPSQRPDPCADAGPSAIRIAGGARIGTAVAVARAGWGGTGASTVVLASGRAFPDALAASPWAAEHDAPILLTEPAALPDVVAGALRELATQQVVIVGGTDAVSQRVSDELEDAGLEVRRLAGPDRAGTAAAIADDLDSQSNEAVIVTARAFADAVAAGPLVTGRMHVPVLLTEDDHLPAATIAALERHAISRATVVGGPAVVADSVLADLERRGVSARRVSGDDRFGTSAAVVDETADREGQATAAVVVTATDFPDALAANAYAARLGATLLLVDHDDLIDHPVTVDALQAHGAAWHCTAVIGGTGAVGVRVAEQVTARTGARPPDGDPVLLAAGDIAACGLEGDEATAALLAGTVGTVLTLGDNAYENGSAAQYRSCYVPSWGEHLVRTRATLGNHDIRTAAGGPTYDLFGVRAGNRGEGWHAFDLGPDWRVLVLNSNCPGTVRCDADSPQHLWLRDQLDAAGGRHIIIATHHPRWSSGVYAPGETRIDALWRLAADHGADVWLAGHEHGYERFDPKDGDGDSDPDGIQQMTAGTGGASLRPFGDPQPGSRITVERHGVLALTLRPDGYAWKFLDTDGHVLDQGERHVA